MYTNQLKSMGRKKARSLVKRGANYKYYL